MPGKAALARSCTIPPATGLVKAEGGSASTSTEGRACTGRAEPSTEAALVPTLVFVALVLLVARATPKSVEEAMLTGVNS